MYDLLTDFPTHPTAAQLSAYYQSYASHFDLNEKIVYKVCVTEVKRDQESQKWLLSVANIEFGNPEYNEGWKYSCRACTHCDDQPFEKIVLATGSEQIPKMPSIEGLFKFGVKTIHGQAFKNTEDFDGQRVMVVGQGNSAMDAAVVSRNMPPASLGLSDQKTASLT